MNRNYAERNLTLEFPIKDVKEKITKVIKAGVGTYVSPEINEMMGTYSFSMSRGGVFGCKMVITVNKIDEGNTSLSVNAKNLGHDNTSDSILEQFITDFLKVLSEALSGKEITSELVSSNTRGCAGVILIFLILSFLLLVVVAKAQTTADTTKFVYCELVGTQKFLSTKVVVKVDFGEEKKLGVDTRIREETTGNVQAFNSMVDALNYMGNRGWEFVQAYVITEGEHQNVYHWLLKRKK